MSLERHGIGKKYGLFFISSWELGSREFFRDWPVLEGNWGDGFRLSRNGEVCSTASNLLVHHLDVRATKLCLSTFPHEDNDWHSSSLRPPWEFRDGSCFSSLWHVGYSCRYSNPEACRSRPETNCFWAKRRGSGLRTHCCLRWGLRYELSR